MSRWSVCFVGAVHFAKRVSSTKQTKCSHNRGSLMCFQISITHYVWRICISIHRLLLPFDTQSISVIGYIYIHIYNIYIHIHTCKWHVCLGSYILEQEESRDIRKKGRVGEKGQGGN